MPHISHPLIELPLFLHCVRKIEVALARIFVFSPFLSAVAATEAKGSPLCDWRQSTVAVLCLAPPPSAAILWWPFCVLFHFCWQPFLTTKVYNIYISGSQTGFVVLGLPDPCEYHDTEKGNLAGNFISSFQSPHLLKAASAPCLLEIILFLLCNYFI